MFNVLKYKINSQKRKIEWRKKNKHNSTFPVGNEFDINSVEVGNYTYGGIKVLNLGSNNKLHIGNFCSIADDVIFMVCAEHNIKSISTFPFKVRCLGIKDSEATSKGDIIVDDDVWIGQNATILSGVHIGQGAVIAAGAVVSKDVPPYSIVGGVPAKVIAKRFDDEMIEELLKIDYSKITKEDVENNIDSLYEELNSKSQIKWMFKE